MRLFPESLLERLPALSGLHKPKDAIVLTRFLCPWSNWVWLVIEGQRYPSDVWFYGYVKARYEGWGYFSSSELNLISGPGGLMVIQDKTFKPTPFLEVIKELRKPG